MNPEFIIQDMSPQIKGALPEFKEGANQAVEDTDTVGHEDLKIGLTEIKRPQSENLILQLLEDKPLYFDEIIGRLNMGIESVNASLLKLELTGAVKRAYGGKFVLN